MDDDMEPTAVGSGRKAITQKPREGFDGTQSFGQVPVPVLSTKYFVFHAVRRLFDLKE
jgi:hypothetical protein